MIRHVLIGSQDHGTDFLGNAWSEQSLSSAGFEFSVPEDHWVSFSPDGMSSGDWHGGSFVVSSDTDTVSSQSWMMFSRDGEHDFGAMEPGRWKSVRIDLGRRRALGGVSFLVEGATDPISMAVHGSDDGIGWICLERELVVGHASGSGDWKSCVCHFRHGTGTDGELYGSQHVCCEISNGREFPHYRLSFRCSSALKGLRIGRMRLHEPSAVRSPFLCLPLASDSWDSLGRMAGIGFNVSFDPSGFAVFGGEFNSSLTYPRLLLSGMGVFSLTFQAMIQGESPHGTMWSKGDGLWLGVSSDAGVTRLLMASPSGDPVSWTAPDGFVGSWHHFAFVFDSGSASLLVDGVLAMSSSGLQVPGSSDDFNVGCMTANGSGRNDFISGMSIRRLMAYGRTVDVSDITEEMRRWRLP